MSLKNNKHEFKFEGPVSLRRVSSALLDTLGGSIMGGTVGYGFTSENSCPDFEPGNVEVTYNESDHNAPAIFRHSKQISETPLWDLKAYLSEENLRDYKKLIEKQGLVHQDFFKDFWFTKVPVNEVKVYSRDVLLDSRLIKVSELNLLRKDNQFPYYSENFKSYSLEGLDNLIKKHKRRNEILELLPGGEGRFLIEMGSIDYLDYLERLLADPYCDSLFRSMKILG